MKTPKEWVKTRIKETEKEILHQEQNGHIAKGGKLRAFKECLHYLECVEEQQ